MHGPKRIFQGKGRAMGFWVMMCTVAMALLIFQTVQLLTIYFSKPTLSQVSFIVNDTGLHFPAITICNFNPIKKSHVRELNASGDLSGETLQYFLLTNADAMTIYSNPDRGKLKRDNDMAEEYIKNHTDFKITHFLKTAGYECEEMFKKCYFGGRRFECCQLMKPIITGLGKCFQLDLGHRGHEWMRKQKWPGVEAGLQIIADAHLEEVLSKSTDSAGPIFSNLFENGFRYYVHDVSQVPYLSSEGVSASPSTTVYSAIKTSTHQLLTVDEWGNCTRDWPPGYRTSLQYSAQSCKYLCLADHFMKMCNCSPFTYNIDGKRPICTPLQTVTCMGQNMGPFVNGSQSLNLPECGECRMECESTSYHAYNSYGNGFNEGALFWMQQNSENVTDEHIKKNYVIINIFFREMFYTAYTQVTATSLTEILSDIGGNMGMFLGMSVITITELYLYFSKMFWICMSKRRRDYLFSKKKQEEEKKKHLNEAVEEYREMRSRRSSRDNVAYITPPNGHKIAPTLIIPTVAEKIDESEKMERSPSSESVVELKIDINDLKEQLALGTRKPSVKAEINRRKSFKQSSTPTFHIEQPND